MAMAIPKNKSIFSTNEKELLIEIVQSKPSLYDLSSPKYKDRRFTDAAWELIGNKLNKPATDCKEQWTALRTQKRRLYNDLKNVKSGSGREPFIKWEYYKSLSFLEPYFSTGTQSGNLDVDNCIMIDTSDDNNNDDKIVQAEHVLPAPPTPRISKANKNKKTSHEINSVDQLLIEHLEKKEPDDPNKHFLLELGIQLRLLPPVVQTETKMKMQRMLYEKVIAFQKNVGGD